MNISTSTSIFRFATIRNPTDAVTSQPDFEIAPSTKLVSFLIDVIESDEKQPDKIKLINNTLDDFIQSGSFFRSNAEVAAAMSKAAANPTKASASKETATEKEDDQKGLYETLYDNIVVRTLTKSTTNEIFKLLTESIRTLHHQSKAKKISANQTKKLRINLPERLVISFSPPKPIPTLTPKLDHTDLTARLKDLTEQRQRLQQSKDENQAQLGVEQKKILQQQAEEVVLLVNQAQTVEKLNQSSRAKLDQAQNQTSTSQILDQLETKAAAIRSSTEQLNSQLADLSREVLEQAPEVKYTRIGNQWVEIGRFEQIGTSIIEGDSIVVHSANCSLKFPFQVADLRVVEQQTVGYLPAEIAHINNTQQGELHEKVTRRLKRVETFESLITEDESFKETDTQSTDKFTLAKAASEVQSEETAVNVNASVSGTYGVVTASVDAGYSSSQSTQNANSASQSYAREIVQRVVERASNKISKERSLRTLEEFEETVKHIIDNTKATGPKSYVYRWLTKLVRATLKNYGKCLIFQIDIAHPSHRYLSRSITEQPALNLPPDPRGLFYFGKHITFWITRETYLNVADIYKTKLEPPPENKVIVSHEESGVGSSSLAKAASITVPAGYKAVKAYIENILGSGGDPTWNYLAVLIGRVEYQRSTNTGPTVQSAVRYLNGETGALPLALSSPFIPGGYSLNIEVECELEESAMLAWKTKCYYALVDAYDNLKAEAENKMSAWNPNLPGLNPSRKNDLIRTELKKGALSRMFRCNPFWITDNYEVGKEYDPDCCADSLNAEKVRFLETVFDWDNVSYELYPYIYADKDNWAGLLNLSDDDPHFEAFLQASFATVRIPVYRDSLKETAAVNFIMNNSIANYEVVPASVLGLLEEMESATPFKTDADGKLVYEHDSDGNKVPYYSTDLGVFPVPTDLVILECGVENGVKPIGFPQTAAHATDVLIPKQYSPAIIADRCEAPVVNPKDGGTDDSKPPDSTD